MSSLSSETSFFSSCRTTGKRKTQSSFPKVLKQAAKPPNPELCPKTEEYQSCSFPWNKHRV